MAFSRAAPTFCGVPLSNPEKRQLKAEAQRLAPLLKIGKNGVSAAFLQSVDEALTKHRLLKIRFAGGKEQRRELARVIAEKTSSELIQLVGHVAVFFRATAARAA